jgi:Nif-specific regulatory protein
MITMQAKDNFQALYEVSQTIHAILDPQQLLDKILEIAMVHLDAERGCILLQDAETSSGYAVALAKNFSRAEDSTALAESSSVVMEVLKTGESILAFDAMTDERFEASKSIMVQQILSILCIPLRLQEQVIGAVYLDSKRSRRAFTEESQKFLTVFCHLSAIAIDNARKYIALKDENERLRNVVPPAQRFKGILGKSESWKTVLELVHRVSRADISVLITGESGTGKELIARAIHNYGSRSAAPFVAVNCSAIPDTLLESELFGHKKGSFTGANSDKVGLVEAANRGSLFLDEISELSPAMQSKLLRVIQEKELRRVGDVEHRKVDVRLLAASNKNLSEEVKKGNFREDLLFRLNVVNIQLPPLRDRKDDIPLLADFFFQQACEQHKRALHSISPEAMHQLLMYTWPGNVRELKNVIERAVVLCSGDSIGKEDVYVENGDRVIPNGSTLEEYERHIIEVTLQEMGGNRTRTAEKLGVSLRWLQYRLKEWSNE